MKKESPVEKFPGHIILPDYLTLPQVRAFEDALDGLENIGKGKKTDRVWLSVIDEKRLPAILESVQEWHIEGIPEKLTVDNFPMTPVSEANKLINWVFQELRALWLGETEVPNA